jgi:ElaB/YqjD/DUF883 family membrane-anchored ribosome-binding protein
VSKTSRHPDRAFPVLPYAPSPTLKSQAKIFVMNTRHHTSTAETPEQLIEHISRLMAEAEAMIAGPVSDQSPGNLTDIKERLESARVRLNDVYTRARTNVVAGAKYTDETIRQHPYQSLAIALGIGVLLGALIRRNGS